MLSRFKINNEKMILIKTCLEEQKLLKMVLRLRQKWNIWVTNMNCISEQLKHEVTNMLRLGKVQLTLLGKIFMIKMVVFFFKLAIFIEKTPTPL